MAHYNIVLLTYLLTLGTGDDITVTSQKTLFRTIE